MMEGTVVKHFARSDDLDLSLEVGQEIIVLNNEEDGLWAWGRIGQRVGQFPKECVKLNKLPFYRGRVSDEEVDAELGKYRVGSYVITLKGTKASANYCVKIKRTDGFCSLDIHPTRKGKFSMFGCRKYDSINEIMRQLSGLVSQSLLVTKKPFTFEELCEIGEFIQQCSSTELSHVFNILDINPGQELDFGQIKVSKLFELEKYLSVKGFSRSYTNFEDTVQYWLDQDCDNIKKAERSMQRKEEKLQSKLNCKISIYQGDMSLLEADCFVNAGGSNDEGRLSGRNRMYMVVPEGEDEGKLKACYQSCLYLAMQQGLKSIAFPCISTGFYSYQRKEATKIAIGVVKYTLRKACCTFDKIIFCVSSSKDRKIYNNLM